jgi:tetratricopeptide (TPR) repeat protein
MKIKPVYQACLLVFMILGIYYPTLFAGFNTIDDFKLINRILNMESWNWWQSLKPGSSFYYRPLLIYTFYLDKHLWGLDPGFMHLGNMLLHAGNALLVFFIARRVCSAIFFKVLGLLPLSAALLFALHPINTESVNWVSGRTDLLATFFVLSSLLLLIRCIESRRWAWAVPAALIFLAGVMSKEVVLFFLPAGCYLLWRWPAGDAARSLTSLRIRSMTCFASPFVIGVTVYGILRFTRFGTGDAGFNFVLNHYGYDLNTTLRVVFKVFGFYVKKLFVPVPLNFAITNAHDAYVWLGLATALALVAFIRLRRLAVDFLVVALALIAPAVIIALTKVAWTPLAERYLYLSSAFWAVALAVMVCQAGPSIGRPILLTSVATVALTAAGWVTYERNLVWQSNLTLFEDTVRKSPNFPPARNELATALSRAGRNEESMEQLALAGQCDSGTRVLNVHFNAILGLIREKDYNGTRNALAQLQNNVRKRPLRFLEQMVKINEAMLRSFPEDDRQKQILPDLLAAYEQLMARKSDPFLRYRAGQLAMRLEENGKALAYFTESYHHAPDSAYYKPAALILLRKLSENETPSHH